MEPLTTLTRQRWPGHRGVLATLIALLAILVLAGPARGRPSDPAPHVAQLRDLALYVDKTGADTIDAVAAATVREPARFRPLPGNSFAGGYTRDVHWLRFTVEGPAGEWWLDLLPPFLDDLRLYEPDPARPGAWLERRAGDTLPFSAREVDYRGFVFKLRHASAEPRNYYLRIQTTSHSSVLLRVSPPETFFARASLEGALLMAILGVMVAVIFFEINASAGAGDSLTPWFLAFLLSMLLNLAGFAGFLQQYVFPETPSASYYGVGLSAFLAMAFGSAFYRRLFGVDRRHRVLYLLYETNFWLMLAGCVSLPLDYYPETQRIASACMLAASLIGAWLSLRKWREASAGGGMMLTANLISMSGLFVYMLSMQGYVSGGFALMHSFQTTAIGSIFALRLAVDARYRALRDERLKVERDATNEREVRRRQGEFLSMLAHELRTSLTVLRMAFGVQPMSVNAMASVDRAMNSMGEILERSLQAEKIAEGSLEVESLPCDLGELIESIAAGSREPARVRVEMQARLRVNTDAKLLRVILSNLVDNALKYGRGDANVEVFVEHRASSGAAVTVSNLPGAVGWPDPERIFEKYYRAPQAHGYTGSGLGLHVARAMARLLGGALDYLPDEDRITFRLQLK